MIKKASFDEVNNLIDYAYNLANDISKSAFPTYLDGIKTKKDFENSLLSFAKKDHVEVLLFYIKNEIKGVIKYYFLKEDKYIGVDIFNVEENTEMALDEFLNYIKIKFNGYEVFFGFPKENKEAISYFNKKNFQLVEESDVYSLHLNDYNIGIEDNNIKEVDLNNFSDFKKLHDGIEMYWNSDRLYKMMLKKDNNPWHLYIYYENNEPMANIYFIYTDILMEIFGIDFKDEIINKDILKKLLTKALNKSKLDGVKHLGYFAEGIESNVAKELGMIYIAKYHCYKVRI